MSASVHARQPGNVGPLIGARRSTGGDCGDESTLRRDFSLAEWLTCLPHLLPLNNPRSPARAGTESRRGCCPGPKRPRVLAECQPHEPSPTCSRSRAQGDQRTERHRAPNSSGLGRRRRTGRRLGGSHEDSRAAFPVSKSDTHFKPAMIPVREFRVSSCLAQPLRPRSA